MNEATDARRPARSEPVNATAAAPLVRSVLAAAGQLGADPRVLAREAGLPGWTLKDHRLRYPVVHYMRLWRILAWQPAERHLGIRIADQWRFGTWRLWDYLADTATTLGEAFSLTVRYSPLVINSGYADRAFSTDGESGVVRFTMRAPDPGVDAILTDFVFGSWLAKARYATGRPVAPRRVSFATVAPRTHKYLVEAFGTRRIDFGAEASTMTFDRTHLDLPLVRSDPVLAEILRENADAEIAAVDLSPRWIDRFRRVVADCMDDRSVRLESAARRLGVSPRTLQRLLEREDTSWRAEVDVARRDREARLLARGVNKSAIARHLGYGDTRALRRAARRWS